MLRIRDLYPGHRILIFTLPDPGLKQQQKRWVKKTFWCHTFFCSHKFHKIENYFIFGMPQKKIGPIFNVLEDFLPLKLSLSSQKYGFGFWNPGSEIQDPEKPIPDPGSSGQQGT